MKKLLLFTTAFVLMLFTQVQAASVDTVKAAIVKYSIEMGVDPAITLSIAKTESGFKHETKSPHGAVGVFQLMPSTARRMGLNPYSLEDNIKGGIMYYKSMYQMFGSMQLAIAAYNAGPANVKRYNSIPPYRETKRFVSKIMADYYYLKAHTDPAVLAYQKMLKDKEKAIAQKSSEQKVASTTVIEVKEEKTNKIAEHQPKQATNTTPSNVKAPIPSQIVAQTYKKAPTPKVEHHNKNNKENSIESDIKVQAVEL